MSAGTQCDNCRVFGPSQAPGWFWLQQQPGKDDQPQTVFAALFGSHDEPLTFCTVKCLADWAYVHAAASDVATGTEPG